MTDFETHPIGTAAKLAAYEARSVPMTDLRKRLAEVLEGDAEPGHFLRDPALARALEDAERVAALEAENAALRRDNEALREDAERYRWGVKHARWIRHEHEAYVAIPVALDADLSCEAMRTHAIDAARGK